MTLCKQDGIFIERPEPEPPVDGCVYAMSVDIGVIYEPEQDSYNFGETVMYMIYVENIGTCELTDIVVTDETGGSEFTIPVLAPGEIQEFYSEYVVTSSDIVNQEVYLFVSADSAETHAQNHKSLSVRMPYPLLSAYVYGNNEGEWAWTVGETVEIVGTFANSGNIDLKYATITLYLDTGESVDREIEVIHPNESFQLRLTHTLTQDDVSNGFNGTSEIIGYDIYGQRDKWDYRTFYDYEPI